jgi:two-component system sensor kinase FixL
MGPATYVTFYPAVVVALVVGGLPAGLLAAALSVVAVQFWINPYDHRQEWAGLAVFLMGSVVTALALRLLQFTVHAHLSHDFQRRQNAQLRAIVDSALEGMVTIDEQGFIQYANPAALEMYGYTADEIVGRNVKLLMSEPDRASYDSHFANGLRAGAKGIIGHRRRVLGRRKNGEIFPKELTVTETSFVDGDRLFLGVMRDLSVLEREKARADALHDELAHASRLNDMGELAATLAHELSQPLAAIANFLGAARRKLALGGSESAALAIRRAEEQTKRAFNILTRLRGFIEKRSPTREPVELQALIEEAVELARLGAGRDAPPIELRAPDEPISVDVDRVQIEQVLVNLLRNAADALTEAAEARIVVEMKANRPGYVRVSVADNGAGVDADLAARLFTPFVTTKAHGLGIGLSLCRSIVERHGGGIGFEPNAPRGAVFFFTLPSLEGQAQGRWRQRSSATQAAEG